MESNHFRVPLVAMLFATLAYNCPAAVLYVDANSSGSTPPYAGWSTAATNIQDAVDVSSAGDTILVTNGVYRFGGRIVYGALTNRVALTKAVSVQSIGGPYVTTIQGGYGQGDISARCVYLTNGASLQGFTLLNGGTRAFVTDNETRGGGVFCESTDAIVTDCILATNTAFTGGGGAYGGTFNNCRFTNNSAGGGQYGAIGGGAVSAILNSCTLVSNFGNGPGGGASSCTLSNCLLLGNTSWGGGAGASNCVLTGCMLLTNSCGGTGPGGGAHSCTLRNCAITGNTALGGSGAIYCTLVNCTVTANQGVGAETCYVTNCILFYNLDGNYGFNGYLPDATISYSCTTPLPPTGTGNFTNNPLLASWSHISGASPCRGAGLALAAQGTDIDGESWANPPSVGCDEFIPGGATGPLTVFLEASTTNIAPGYDVSFTSQIGGQTSASVWDFGDGTVVSNQPALSHSWVSDGNYPVVLRAFNDTYSGGISATVLVHVLTVPIHYVSVTSTNPVTPYATWDTAATNIQDAIDSAYAGQTILVTNGLYRFGGAKAGRDTLTTNRVAVAKTLTVGSVNGPRFTTIQGSGSPANPARCVYLADGCVLFGFTLTNGFGYVPPEACADFFGGGGVWCETTQATVSNCVIVGNTGICAGGGAYGGTLIDCVLATNTSSQGAGSYGSILNNCLLLGNVGTFYSWGGGAYGGTLNNCTLIGNSATVSGGGAHQSILNNCIVYYNSSASGTNFAGGTLSFCDTTPAPGGTGNITSPPSFLDQTNGNFRLQTNSPCINAGSNLYAPAVTDLDGRSRIAGGTVDIGAYEFQSADLSLFTTWLQQFGLPTDGTADFADSDGDGMNNWQEWRSGTNPTNSSSLLKMLPLATTNNAAGVQVSWQSVSGLTYYLQRSSNLAGIPAFSTISSNTIGQAGSTTFSDVTATNTGSYFYRVAVQ